MFRMVRTCLVYALSSSRDGVIRYVGQTFAKLRHRLTGHLHAARIGKRLPVAMWVAEETAAGHAIHIQLLEDNAEHNAAEKRWIAEMQARGLPLLNATAGGAGMLGYRMPPAHRERIRRALAGKAKAPDHVAAVALALAGRKPAPQTIAAARQAAKDKPWSPSRRAACEATEPSLRSERARIGRSRLSPERRSQISSIAGKAAGAKRRGEPGV
jgi:hypothetical protein